MSRPPVKGRRRGREEKPAKRDCMFCRHDVTEVDYKFIAGLRSFVSDKGRIRARRVTGMCRKHQSQAAVAVKRARVVALLKYVGQH